MRFTDSIADGARYAGEAILLSVFAVARIVKAQMTRGGDVYDAKVIAALDLSDLGGHRPAIAWLSRLIKSHPARPRAWFVRALARLERGDDAAALQDLEQCLRLEPDYPGARERQVRLSRGGVPEATETPPVRDPGAGLTMKPETVYAFHCARTDEKLLLERINNYLAGFHRTTSKAKDRDMRQRYLPHVIPYFYWNLNKDAGTWFDVYPNEDADGGFFFPDHQGCGWLMRVRIDLARWTAATPEKAEDFIAGLLAAAGFAATPVGWSDTL